MAFLNRKHHSPSQPTITPQDWSIYLSVRCHAAPVSLWLDRPRAAGHAAVCTLQYARYSMHATVCTLHYARHQLTFPDIQRAPLYLRVVVGKTMAFRSVAWGNSAPCRLGWREILLPFIARETLVLSTVDHGAADRCSQGSLPEGALRLFNRGWGGGGPGSSQQTDS